MLFPASLPPVFFLYPNVPFGGLGHGRSFDEGLDDPAVGKAAAQNQGGNDDPDDGSSRHIFSSFI